MHWLLSSIAADPVLARDKIGRIGTDSTGNIWLSLVQEVRPHQPEAVAVLGHSVQPTCLSSHITLDDLVASLRLEQGEVAAALVKARDSLHEQARLQHEYEAKQAAAAAALLAAEKAKPKARQASLHLLPFQGFWAHIWCTFLVQSASAAMCCCTQSYTIALLAMFGGAPEHLL